MLQLNSLGKNQDLVLMLDPGRLKAKYAWILLLAKSAGMLTELSQNNMKKSSKKSILEVFSMICLVGPDCLGPVLSFVRGEYA